MPKNNNIDVSELDKIIIGRVEPHIYAFSTETVPNYMKVGDTYRPLEVRLDEWRKYFPDLEKQFADIAKVDDETFFRDFAVHKFLEYEKKKKRLIRDNFSKEFFENVKVQDVKDAILDIKDSYSKNGNKYQFYKIDSRHREVYTYLRNEEYEPRPNQQETIDNFKLALQKRRNNLLMYAVMRFGKSFTSMCCATEMSAKVVVIVSAKADVKSEWKKAVESHMRFIDYDFLDSDALLTSHAIVSEKLADNRKIVIFLTLQDLQGEEIKNKHREIFESQLDLLIIDETHFGARADEYGKVLLEHKLTKGQLQNELKQNDNTLDELEKTIKVLNAKVRLHLSGTPYRILMSNEFTKDDIIAFYQFSDIVEEQEKWNAEKLNKDDIKEWDNPYYGFPQMVRFAFNPNESSRLKMKELNKNGITYAFSALFESKSITKDKTMNEYHNRFKHEKEILDLFEVIDGSKNDKNLLSFLDYNKIKNGNMCRHIVCVLPYRASCDALETLIKKNKFKNLNSYEIINIAGIDNEKQYKNTQTVKEKIKNSEAENKKTITLTVNRMLTGSTVEEWDTMLYFKDTASPQEYDQAIFRLQNQFIKTGTNSKGDIIKINMKPQTLLVDFDPDRMFRMQEQKSQIYNVNTDANGNTKLKQRIEYELKISPIIVINHNKIEQVTPTNILEKVSDYSKNKSVLDEATAIPVDFSLLGNELIRTEIEKQGKIGSKQGLEIKPIEGKGEDIDISFDGVEDKENAMKETNADSSTNFDSETEKNDFKSKFAMYYARILFFSFLSSSEVKSLQDIISQIDKDENNKRILVNLDLNKEILLLLKNKIDPFILSKLDYKIQNINSLANDKGLKPIDRASNAMKKFYRLSDSEIVTPEKVSEEMVDIFPDGAINNSTKLLDIAAKQGEFVYAIYKRYGKDIAKNFYSIPTSKIAYEFTRKVYDLLDLDILYIASEYTAYDLIKKDKDIFEDDKIKIGGSNMKFDVIIGNPPYDEKDGSGGSSDSAAPIYNTFIEQAIKTNPNYLVMIVPAKWMVGGRRELTGFREKMIKEKRLRILFDFEKTSDCFPLPIDGGICYFLWDKNYTGKTKYTFKSNDGTTIKSERYLENDYFPYVVRDTRILSIIERIAKERRFSDIVSKTKPFGIRTYLFNEPNRYPNSNLQYEPFAGSIKIYGVKGIKGGAKRTIGYISPEIITKNKEAVSKYKLFFTTVFSTNAITPPEVIEGGPNDVCTETFLLVGPFDNREEQINCKSYINTNFFKVLLYFGKGTMHVNKDIFGLIPLQDFTEQWTDEKLYEKYKLKRDEIGLIEDMTKQKK